MSEHGDAYYVRALPQNVQLALLTRIRAFDEPDEDAAFVLMEQAIQHLSNADCKISVWLLDQCIISYGWGATKLNIKPQEISVPFIYSAEKSVTQLNMGNPLMAEHALSYNKMSIEVLNILVRLGFPTAMVAMNNMDLIIPDIRKYCRGLNIDVLVICATYSLDNLMYVFGLIRRRDPTRCFQFWSRLSEAQQTHCEDLGDDSYDGCLTSCIHCDRWYKTDRVLRFIHGWMIRGIKIDETTPKYDVDDYNAYHERMSKCRRAVITWLLCARGICHKDIARVIGQLVYAARFDLAVLQNGIKM